MAKWRQSRPESPAQARLEAMDQASYLTRNALWAAKARALSLSRKRHAARRCDGRPGRRQIRASVEAALASALVGAYESTKLMGCVGASLNRWPGNQGNPHWPDAVLVREEYGSNSWADDHSGKAAEKIRSNKCTKYRNPDVGYG